MFVTIKGYLKGKKEIITLIKESSLSFILKVLGILLSYLLTLVISIKFGVEGLGIFSLITTISLVGIYILKFGFDTALLKLSADLESRNERFKIKKVYLSIIKVIVPVTIFATILLLFYSEFLAIKLFNKPYLKPSLTLCAFIFLPYVLILIHSEGLRGLNKVNAFVFLQNVGIYLFAILLIFGNSFFFKGDANTPITLYVISLYLTLFVSLYLWHKQIGHSVITESYSLKRISNIAMPMWLSSVMMILIGWSDTIMLGIFSNEENVGLYSVALKTANLVLIPQATVNNVIAPKIVSLYTQSNMISLKKLISRFSIIILLTSLPAYLFLIIFPEFVLGIFGKEFIIGKNILIILATSQFINALCGPADVFLQMVGKEKVLRNFITIATLLNISVNFITIPKFGAYGSAFTAIGSILAWKGASVIYIRWKFGINLLPGFKV